MSLAPTSTPIKIQSTWTHTLANPARGMVLAREKGWILARDQKDWLYLMNQSGERQAQVRTTGKMAAACCADDGSAYAATGSEGEVWFLAPDLSTRWERTVPQRAVAVALDPFGQYLAVADAKGGLVIFDRQGRPVSQIQSPRPMHHLAFIPAAPFLLGASDFGLVGCLDMTGRWVWRDGLVAHIGSISVSGSGEKIALACFTEGLQQYSLTGKNMGRQSLSEACRLAALTFDGRMAMVAGLSNRLLVVDQDGHTLCTHHLDQSPVSLVLGPLGNGGAVLYPDGSLTGLDLRKSQ